MDYSDKKVMIGLSAGINSAAVLIWIASLPEDQRPKEIHLYYAHFVEHSPDSLQFVLELAEWAKTKFEKVVYKQTDNSIMGFFEKSKMIPHPARSSCSRILKILPMMEYMAENKLDLDLIGYVKEEKRRATKMRTNHAEDSKLKEFPIIDENNEWCFDIVKEKFGWYPKIYDLRWNDPLFIAWLEDNLHRLPEYEQNKVRKKIGANARVFKHNNCLPCKNMYLEEMLIVEYAYPDYMKEAIELSDRLKKFWGRNADPYYTTFGKSDYEAEQCETCKFD
jgi:hypothetical protein